MSKTKVWNLCDSCANAYMEYGCLLCKYEGDEWVPEEYGEDKPVTSCPKYEEEVDYEF